MRTLYYNGNIITMDKKLPKVEAVLTENNKIIAVGDYSKLLSKVDENTKKFDLQKMALLPGFIDSHSHSSLVAMFVKFVDLAPSLFGGTINSVSDVQEALKKELSNNPKKYGTKNWLIGCRYENKDFPNNEKVTKFDLDEVSKEIPIIVIYISSHAAVANSKFLELLHINENTINPNDSNYERVEGSKEPNGILKESALLNNPRLMLLIALKIINKKNWSDTWKLVVRYYASQGYTVIQDGNLIKSAYKFLNYLDKKNQLVLDVIGHVSALDKRLLALMKMKKWGSRRSNKFKVKGIKMIMDGTLGLRTSWLSQPYCPETKDGPFNDVGKPTIDLQLAYETIVWCLKNNKQVIAHCMGDQACEKFISFYQKALQETKVASDIRPILIHATTVRYDQLERMKKIGMTPSFIAEDFYYFGDFCRDLLIGEERAENLSPAGWTRKLDMKFSIHHDCPIFVPNSMMILYSAVTRMLAKKQLLGKEQRVTMQEALEAITINPAYQYHEDEVRGSIAVGKFADFVILNDSPLSVPIDKVMDIKIMKTIKDGVVVYSHDE